MAQKHDRRKRFPAKVSRYLSVGIGVILIQETVFGNIDIVSSIGDCFLTQAACFAAHQQGAQFLAQFIGELSSGSEEFYRDWRQFPFSDLTTNQNTFMSIHGISSVS
jgi:hypothetical protein